MLNILEKEDFINGEIYMAPTGDGLNFDEESNDKIFQIRIQIIFHQNNYKHLQTSYLIAGTEL